jgi:protein dithiol:quinone oxidoreductase
MLNTVMAWLDTYPRRVMGLLSLICVAMLAFGLYLQHSLGLEPCPMCIVQRYALILIAVFAALAGASGKKSLQIAGAAVVVVLALLGAFVAARQSWLQWYPPEIASCGRDLFGMIENFPLKRVIPMLLKGSGDCTKIDWTFLGGSIANWSFLWFCAFALVGALIVWRRGRAA